MNTILRLLATAAATAVAAWVVPGITVAGHDTTQKAIALVVVAAIFGLVNALVKPLFQALTGCLIVVTLGLFLLVINALMLMLTSWIAQQVGIGFAVDGFVSAVVGSVIISLVAGLLTALLPDDRKRERRA